MKEHSSVLLFIMRLMDGAILLASGHIAYALYLSSEFSQMNSAYQAAFVIAWLSSLVIFPAYGVYRPWRGTSRGTELASVLLAWVTVFGFLIFLTFATQSGEKFSRVWLVAWFLGGGTCLLSSRFLLRTILRYLRSVGFNQRLIVIIGSGDVAKMAYRNLSAAKEAGFIVKGFFSDDVDVQKQRSKEMVVGCVAEAREYAQEIDCDQVWIAMPLSASAKIEEVVSDFADSCADIRLVPDIFGFKLINQSVTAIAGLPVVNLSVTPMMGVNRWIKSVEDKLLSFTILLMISPILILISLGIKLTSIGPVLYRQDRVSWNGKIFPMYKFRSMPVNTEASSGAVWAKDGEVRATSFGAFLRRTSLDELPQFFNVLKGDMSIVGPRPERPVFVDQFKEEVPGYMKKHKVKAGITGWAQVNGWRGDTCIKTRVEHDLYYINTWSLWFDLKIIVLTLFKGFVHKNAY
jgi:putative colanic acid biosynthesis UDP-glucose lipid carrier transferase